MVLTVRHRGRRRLVAGAGRGPDLGRGRPVGPAAPPAAGPPLRRPGRRPARRRARPARLRRPAPRRFHHRRHRRHRRRPPLPRPAGDPGPRRGRPDARRSRSGWRCATWPATRPAPAPRSARSPSPSASPPRSPSARPRRRRPHGRGNLPADQLMLYVTPAGGRQPGASAERGPAAGRRPAAVERLASAIHAGSVLPLDQAYNPQGALPPAQPGGPVGGQPSRPATRTAVPGQGDPDCPHGEDDHRIVTALRRHPGRCSPTTASRAGQVDPASDIITSRRDLGGLQLFAPELRSASAPLPGAPRLGHPKTASERSRPSSSYPPTPPPPARSSPAAAMQTLGLQAIPAAWLIQTQRPAHHRPDRHGPQGRRRRRSLRRDPEGADNRRRRCGTGRPRPASSWPSACSA